MTKDINEDTVRTMASSTAQSHAKVIFQVATKVIPEHPDSEFDIRVATSLTDQNGDSLAAKYRVLIFKQISFP